VGGVGGEGGEGGGGKPDPGAELGSVALEQTLWQRGRLLRIANASGEKITVHVQYRTQAKGDDWAWFPGEPGDTDQSVTFELEDGEVIDAMDNDWAINASQIRFWAKSETKEWVQFKDKDLWLVPEKDEDGNPGYKAQDMQRFNLTVR
jgi:hypothetical protein